MKTKRKYLYISALLLPALLTNANCRTNEDSYDTQSNFHPYRIAVKVGSPNLVGLEFEALVPGVGNWLGVWLDGTYLPIGNGSSSQNGVETEKEKGGLNHIGIGTNFYFTGRGSGFLASIGYDRVSAYNTIVKTSTGKKSWVNPTHLFSPQLAYKYIGTYFTYSIFGGYGLNFSYSSPELNEGDEALFKKGNWIQAGFSIGIALPFQNDI